MLGDPTFEWFKNISFRQLNLTTLSPGWTPGTPPCCSGLERETFATHTLVTLLSQSEEGNVRAGRPEIILIK